MYTTCVQRLTREHTFFQQRIWLSLLPPLRTKWGNVKVHRVHQGAEHFKNHLPSPGPSTTRLHEGLRHEPVTDSREFQGPQQIKFLRSLFFHLFSILVHFWTLLYVPPKFPRNPRSYQL